MNLLIIAVVLVALFIFMKTTGFRYGQLITWSIGAVLLFFVISMVYVINGAGIDSIDGASGVFQLLKVYFSWLGQAVDNAAVITGDATNLNWNVNETG